MGLDCALSRGGSGEFHDTYQVFTTTRRRDGRGAGAPTMSRSSLTAASFSPTQEAILALYR